MYLLNDSARWAFFDPVVIAGMLLGLGALIFGLVQRRTLRLRPPRGPAYQVFREDLAHAALAWGFAQLAFGAGWVFRVEALRLPIWSYLTLLVGVAILALAWRRERRPWPALAKTDGVELLSDGRIQRGEGQTWEMGYLIAGGLALVSYLASAGHAYPHPLHWLTTIFSMPVGYGLGLVIWTPRFKLTAVRAKRNTGLARPRSTPKQPAKHKENR
jgi:hypothetical protein